MTGLAMSLRIAVLCICLVLVSHVVCWPGGLALIPGWAVNVLFGLVVLPDLTFTRWVIEKRWYRHSSKLAHGTQCGHRMSKDILYQSEWQTLHLTFENQIDIDFIIIWHQWHIILKFYNITMSEQSLIICQWNGEESIEQWRKVMN